MAVKKAFGFVRDCVEKYIPSIALAALFIIFCYQVFMRYVLRQPQAWAGEVEQSCFLWLVLLGACYAQRMKAHVTFTLLASLRPRLSLRLSGCDHATAPIAPQYQLQKLSGCVLLQGECPSP